MNVTQILVVLATSVAAAVLSAKVAVTRWGGDFTKLSAVGGFLSALAAAGSIFLDGLGMQNVQTVLLAAVFLYAAYGDIKTHEADDFIHVLVLAIALITKPAEQMPNAILSAVVLGGIMLLVAGLVRGSGIGGADIKFVAACAFLTTLEGGFFGLGLGTFTALLFNSPFRKKDGAGKGFPMLPYLSFSYMLVYLLF